MNRIHTKLERNHSQWRKWESLGVHCDQRWVPTSRCVHNLFATAFVRSLGALASISSRSELVAR